MKIYADEAKIGKDVQQSMESFGISIAIVIGVLLVPILIFAIFKPVNIASGIVSNCVRKPKTALLIILVVSLICEIAIALIPSTEVRGAFAIISRLINVSLWIFATFVFCTWLVLESYDAFAAESGWFSSADVGLLLSPEGRNKIYENRTAFKHLERYVSKKKSKLHLNATKEYPRLDIRPTRWLQHAASKETREMWAPILEAFFPYAKSIKQNALKQ